MGKVGSRMASTSSHSTSIIVTLRSTGSGFVEILMYQSLSELLHLLESTTFGSHRVECFQLSLEELGDLCIFSSCLSFPSSVHFSGRMCHRSIETSRSTCTLLDEFFFVSHNYQHVGRYSSSVSHH